MLKFITYHSPIALKHLQCGSPLAIFEFSNYFKDIISHCLPFLSNFPYQRLAPNTNNLMQLEVLKELFNLFLIDISHFRDGLLTRSVGGAIEGP